MGKIIVSADANIVRYLQTILERQFSKCVSEILSDKERLEIEISPRTKRIKYVYLDGKRLFSFRASDGWLTVSPLFAKLIIGKCAYPRHRVVADDGVVLKGSLLAPGVLECDNDIRPGDEVLVVNKRDELMGIGKAKLSCEGMETVLKGEAVRIRWSYS